MDTTRYEQLKGQLREFMKKHIYPNEELFHEQTEAMGHLPGNQWVHPDIVVELQKLAKAQGLWNLWLPKDTAEFLKELDYDDGRKGEYLTNAQYGPLCEIMGTANHMEFAAQVMNCSSPDTGNMETIARYGTLEQKREWLVPLLEGRIRSCFAMTEPAVASSDASNISIDIQDDKQGNYVVNGRKWYITGAGSLHCKIMILMGKTNPSASSYLQQSMLLVPMDTPGITLVRPMHAMGDPEAPKGHMEILYENVRVPKSSILLGEGRGFEIAQGRLGPGRIHHCMRAIGTAERAISIMTKRANERSAFGKKLAQFDTVLQDIAKSRAEVVQARMLVQHAAHLLDTVGNKAARQELSMCKAVVPIMLQTVVDRAMQIHGAMGISQDTFLPTAFAWARWLRYADGPDEVHLRTVARIEISKQKNTSALYKLGYYSTEPKRIHRRSTDPPHPSVVSKL